MAPDVIAHYSLYRLTRALLSYPHDTKWWGKSKTTGPAILRSLIDSPNELFFKMGCPYISEAGIKWIVQTVSSHENRIRKGIPGMSPIIAYDGDHGDAVSSLHSILSWAGVCEAITVQIEDERLSNVKA